MRATEGPVGGISERRERTRGGSATRAIAKQSRYRPMAIDLRDISSQGCGFESACVFDPGDRVLLTLPGLEVWPATVTWWRDGRGGLSFSRPLHPAVAERFAVS